MDSAIKLAVFFQLPKLRVNYDRNFDFKKDYLLIYYCQSRAERDDAVK